MIFQPPDLDRASTKVLGRIEDLEKRLGAMLDQPGRWSGLLHRTAFAKALRGASTIDGGDLTVDDAVAAVEEEAPLETDGARWSEVVGYRMAMAYVLQLARDPHFAHSLDLVRSLHFMMLRHDPAGDPGLWRPGSGQARDRAKGEVVYEGPDAGRVPGLMAELVETLNADDARPPVMRAAMAHLNLAMIHPFRDGNGRMARCLQTLVLARGGRLPPFSSGIEEYLGRNARAYRDALEAVGRGRWQPARDSRPWIRFCLTAHFRQTTTALNRVERMRRIWDDLEREARRRRLHGRTLFALADAALGHRVRNPTYRRAADVSENLASRDLKLLVDQGLLEPRGEKRGRCYVATWIIQEVRRVNETPDRVIPDPFG